MSADKIEFQYFEQIEAYQEGRMSPKERAAFEQSMESNAALRKEYEAYLATQEVLQILAYQELNNNQKRKTRRLIPQKWLIAASFLLLLGIIGVVYWQITAAPARLAIAYYERPFFDLDRQSTATTLRSGIVAFYEENFEQSIWILQQIPPQDAQYLEAQYVLAHAFFQYRQLNESADLFLSLIENSSFPKREEARWYRLLALLRAGEKKNFEVELEYFLADTTSAYFYKAERLKEDL